MAEWIYRQENKRGGYVVEPVDGQHWNKLIAQDVSPEHGPLLAMARRMERLMFRCTEGVQCDPDASCDCISCEAIAILRELDAARGPAGKAGEAPS